MYIGHLAEVPGSNPATGAYRYYATDLIRSTRALFDQSKAQIAGYEYTPYGELYASSGSVSTTHRFTGHDWDATAGHYFAPYRYYRPDMARWLSPDPAGFVDGLNVYGYVRGNPVSRFDPSGLCDCDSAARKKPHEDWLDCAARVIECCRQEVGAAPGSPGRRGPGNCAIVCAMCLDSANPWACSFCAFCFGYNVGCGWRGLIYCSIDSL